MAASPASTRGSGEVLSGATEVYVRGECGEDGWVPSNVEKLVCLPTQRYNVPSRKFGRKIVTTLSVELNGIQDWKWNSERVIVFQLVILQRSQDVNNAKNIRAHTVLNQLLELWRI